MTGARLTGCLAQRSILRTGKMPEIRRPGWWHCRQLISTGSSSARYQAGVARKWMSGLGCSGLGLGQYEAVFRENEIDVDVLTELTDQHLKDLGVPLGHRLKMLRAIRELAGRAKSEAAGRSRSASTDRDVLRSRRLDRADGAARSGRHGRSDPRVSGRGRGRGRALRRPCRQMAGRRRLDLFRLSARP